MAVDYRAKRLALGLTQFELATEAGVAKRTVQRHEAKIGQPQMETHIKLMRVLRDTDRLARLARGY